MELLHISYLAPEIMLMLGSCILLIADLYVPKENSLFCYGISLLILAMSFYLLSNLWTAEHLVFFEGMFVVDRFSLMVKMVLLVFAALIFVYSKPYLMTRDQIRGEYFVLCLFSLLGMFVVASASHFLSLYLGIELLVLPLYALIARFKEQPDAIEAAMKYFVMGAIASGMMLYGISVLFGLTGHFNFNEISVLLMQGEGSPPVAAILGIILVMAGIAFKLGAVPFHLWIPDIYQGSSVCITLFIAVLPKIAGVAMAIRVFQGAFVSLTEVVQHALVAFIVASLVLGNLGAILQKNIKRLLGYSAIAHVGFLLMGLLVGQPIGYGPLLIYMLIYAFVILAAFGVLILLSRQSVDCEQLQDLQGLSERHPWLAFLLLVVMFSLAGVPPTVGFYAKFVVLQALVDAGFLWLAVVGLLWSVVGAFYYLKVVKIMYFDAPAKEHFPLTNKGETLNAGSLGLSIVHGLGILGLGLFPAPILWLVNWGLG